MSDYESFSKKPASEKVTIAHVRAKERVKLFSLESGAIYSRLTKYFVEKVFVGTTALVKASSPSLLAGEWFYSVSESKLFVRMFDDSDPKTKSTVLGYRLFFCDSPEILPWDLLTGEDVEHEARIKSTGALKLQLDYENTGIAVESDSTISFENTDGFFDSIFETLIWENQQCDFYTWSPSIPISEARLLYSGVIIDKQFSTSQVSFKLKDQIYRLRDKYPMPVYSESDGTLDPTLIGKPKRFLFGRAKQMRTVGVDKVLDGFEIQGTVSGSTTRNVLSGTVSGLIGQTQINGAGTSFLSQLSPGDKIKVIDGITEYIFTVDTVPNNLVVNIDETIPATFSNLQARNLSILNNIIQGVGTDFENEFSPDDEIIVILNQVEYKYRVELVNSPTEIVTSDEIELAFSSEIAFCAPSVNYRRKNRRHSITGHKIREFITTISEINDAINFKVSSIGDIKQDDLILIGAFSYIVTRVSGNSIRVNQGLDGSISVGNTVVRSPIRKVFAGSQELVFNRDWTYSNTTTDSVLILSALAEFNVSRSQNPSVTFQFTNGSKQIDAVATTIDLTTFLKPRDWIRSRDITHTVWYEVMRVESDKVFVRASYAGPSFTGLSQKRTPAYVGDDTLLTVDCYGLELGGEWIKTAADSVRYIIESLGLENIDEDSFDQASVDCQYAMSYIVPDSPGGDAPIIRDMISEINSSVFGSLYLSQDFQYRYSVLNADRSESLASVADDDVIGTPTVTTKNQIVNKVSLEFRPYTDIFSGQDAFEIVAKESDFTNEASEAMNTLSVKSYLFDQGDAETIAERWLFFRSMAQSLVAVKTKLQFYALGLNDQVFLDLDRLFLRYGGRDRKKIGIVNSITKNGNGIDLVFNDLGNIFNRVAVISPDAQLDYSDASRDEIAKYGFIVDNETETPDEALEAEYGNNLIG